MIVITGASDGLGLELARLYHDTAIRRVVNVSRRECPHADVNVTADLCESQSVTDAARQVLAIDEPLEALVNCAGVYSKQSLGKVSEAEVKRLMATNVESTILLVAALNDRIRRDGTDIVNVASTAGFKGNPNEAAYGASKWALRGFSANLQTELKNTPSRVISFCPGGMRTRLFDKAVDANEVPDTTGWMMPRDVALCLKQLLDLPKNMEVSEIIINKKVLQ